MPDVHQCPVACRTWSSRAIPSLTCSSPRPPTMGTSCSTSKTSTRAACPPTSPASGCGLASRRCPRTVLLLRSPLAFPQPGRRQPDPLGGGGRGALRTAAYLLPLSGWASPPGHDRLRRHDYGADAGARPATSGQHSPGCRASLANYAPGGASRRLSAAPGRSWPAGAPIRRRSVTAVEPPEGRLTGVYTIGSVIRDGCSALRCRVSWGGGVWRGAFM